MDLILLCFAYQTVDLDDLDLGLGLGDLAGAGGLGHDDCFALGCGLEG